MRDREVRFAELRKDNNLKQKYISKILNVSEDRYSKYERCINDMTIEKCNVLANFYNVSLDYLLGLSDYNNREVSRNLKLELLGKKLLTLRKERNLTQDLLGQKLGFLQTTYNGYEIGRVIPTTFKLYCIAEFYNVSIDYLTGKSIVKEIKNE